MYFEDSQGNYNWDGDKIKDAHNWCKHQVEGFMMDSDGKGFKNVAISSPAGYCSEFYSWENFNKIFVANTFTQEWEMTAYNELAKKFGYTVFSIIVENRHNGQNTHNVPPETITKMKDRFQIQL